MPFNPEILGIVAGTLTTLAFIPQVAKVYRTRRADDISLAMFVAFCAGVALWVAYGILTRAVSVILANAITLCLAAAILVGKLRYARHPPEPGPGSGTDGDGDRPPP